MAVSPDAAQLATAGVDGAIRIWNLASGELLRVLVGHNSYVYSLSWSPDGKTLASAGSWDATIRLWNAANGMPLRVFNSPKGYVGRVAWSPNGARLLASGDHSGWILVVGRADRHAKSSVGSRPGCGLARLVAGQPALRSLDHPGHGYRW